MMNDQIFEILFVTIFFILFSIIIGYRLGVRNERLKTIRDFNYFLDKNVIKFVDENYAEEYRVWRIHNE